MLFHPKLQSNLGGILGNRIFYTVLFSLECGGGQIEIRIDMYTLPCGGQIASGNMLCITQGPQLGAL